jgi:hypothetical protein
MKPKINYRAERALRTRKKAEKKEARLAALSKKPEETTVSTDEAPDSGGSLPSVHRFGD